MKEYLSKVVSGENLNIEEAEAAMGAIMSGEATAAQVAAYLTALRMKGETVDEIVGGALAMRAAVAPLPFSQNGEPVLDTCGTGGDSSFSFNISTAAAFVIAGAGVKVAKHGNRAATSNCGSADVLAELGLNLDLAPAEVGRCLDEIGIAFLFAPKFHPAMRHAVGPRREIGFRTIFNVLGPMTNPAGASHQLLGVFDIRLTEKLAKVLRRLGAESALVLHGHGGMDELTTSGPNRVSKLAMGEVLTYDLDPAQLGFAASSNGDLKGGTPAENASRMRALLSGEDQSDLADVVILNAAAGLSLVHDDINLGVLQAREALESGAALEKLEKLVVRSQGFHAVEIQKAEQESFSYDQEARSGS